MIEKEDLKRIKEILPIVAVEVYYSVCNSVRVSYKDDIGFKKGTPLFKEFKLGDRIFRFKYKIYSNNCNNHCIYSQVN